SLRLERKINWISGKPPRSEPVCGFWGEKCDTKPDWGMIIVYSVCCFVTIIAGIFVFRHYRYEHKLACLLWKVDMKDVSCFPSDNDGDFLQLQNVTVRGNDEDRDNCGSKLEDSITGRIKSTIGVYKGNTVHIYHVYKKNIDLTRTLRKEMIQGKNDMREYYDKVQIRYSSSGLPMASKSRQDIVLSNVTTPSPLPYCRKQSTSNASACGLKKVGSISSDQITCDHCHCVQFW
ncbi:guanylate cyclase 32E, partial [Nephila pilipes]